MNESYSVTSDIMQNLKHGFDTCRFVNGSLEPCAYHRNRAETLIVGILDGGGCDTAPLYSSVHHRRLSRTADMKRLLELLASDGRVTGGWWLIREQREWLRRHLAAIFAERLNRPCRVMVSGVAGYAHFYSYMHILFDAARDAGYDISGLSVDAVDSCITPLLEIAYIENSIRRGGSWPMSGVKSRYDIIGFGLDLPAENRHFIKEMIPDIRKCTIRVVHSDILDMHERRSDMNGLYNIITEHFLLSMMESVLQLVDCSRSSYSNLLRENGHLLMACGFSDMDFISNMLKIHENHGFIADETDMVKVWDPFGISRSELQQMTNDDDPLSVALDNCMIDFRLEHRIVKDK